MSMMSRRRGRATSSMRGQRITDGAYWKQDVLQKDGEKQEGE